MMRSWMGVVLLWAIGSTACAGPRTLAPQGDVAMLGAETAAQRDYAAQRRREYQERVERVAQPLFAANGPLCGNRIRYETGPLTDASGQRITAGGTPTPVCNYAIVVDEDADPNASTDGQTIHVNTGMLRFVDDDAQLAAVLAHELGHNVMRHTRQRQRNAVAGAVGGALIDALAAMSGVDTGASFAEAGMEIGSDAYSVEFEQEADYVGMYLLARAGYPLEGAPYLWRRMAAESPGGITESTTHPTYPQRFVAMEAARAEIERKRAAHEVLWPNFASR